MKRRNIGIVVSLFLITGTASATAQGTPHPVIRLGDWVEVGNEVFMNIIASNTIYFRTTDNYDFDDNVRDVGYSRNPTSSLVHFGPGDHLSAETRLGVDMRYQKNLTMRVLLEAQSLFDGNLIDDRSNTTTPGGSGPDALPGQAAFPGPSGENNGFHVERFWIDYRFSHIPLRMRVGAHLWFLDPAGLVADDDPGIFFYLTPGNWEFTVAAIMQQSGARLGLQNDNDNMYYMGSAAYNLKPHRLAFNIVGQRNRFDGVEQDNVLLIPSWTGKFGPVSGLAQFNLMLGTAKATAGAAPTGQEFDVFSWAVIAQAEVDLGMIKPVIALIYARGDDDPNDTDLQGFNNFSHNDIGLTGFTPQFSMFDGFLNDWGPSPARTALAPNGFHTVYNWFLDRLGNNAHTGITSAFSNPGTIAIPVGVKVAPFKGHQVNAWYMYVAMQDAAVLEQLARRKIDETLYHEVGLTWQWTLNPYFDIRFRGVAAIPGDGVKDLAATVTCPDGRPCSGNDPALLGELRFQGRF